MNAALRKITGLPHGLKVFLAINVALGCLCLGCELFCFYVLHYKSPVHNPDYVYTWPTLWFNHWNDFMIWVPRFQHLHHIEFFSSDPSLSLPFTYPAPAAGLYEMFYVYKAHPLRLFLVVTTLVVAVFAAGFYRTMRLSGLAWKPAVVFLVLAGIFSYPFWFEFDLGNMEIWVWIFVAAGVWAYVNDRPYMAAVMFALAGSAKIYPFVFFGLFLSRRRYAPIAVGAAVAVVVNVACLWMIYPNLHVAQHGIQEGMAYFRSHYLLVTHFETGFDHSILGLAKSLNYVRNPLRVNVPSNQRMAPVYMVVMAAAGVFLYFRYIRKLAVINQILALTVASILFTPTSHDYTLLHLYVPWVLLVLLMIRTDGARKVPGLLAAMVCFAVTMSPETELIYHGRSFGAAVKCIALIVLFVIALRYPFREDPIAATA